MGSPACHSADNVNVKDCAFEGNGGLGIVINNGYQVRVQGNVFESLGGASVFARGVYSLIITSNYFEANNMEATPKVIYSHFSSCHFDLGKCCGVSSPTGLLCAGSVCERDDGRADASLCRADPGRSQATRGASAAVHPRPHQHLARGILDDGAVGGGHWELPQPRARLLSRLPSSVSVQDPTIHSDPSTLTPAV